MLSSKIVDFWFCSLVFSSKFLHDVTHALYFLLQWWIVTLNKEHFFFLLSFFFQQARFFLLLLLQLLLQHSFFSNLFFILFTQIIHTVPTLNELLLHFSNQLPQFFLLFLFIFKCLLFTHQFILQNFVFLSLLFFLLNYFLVLSLYEF